MQKNGEWLHQEVRLNKPCFQELESRINYHFRQNTRLEEIQKTFSKKMLKILNPADAEDSKEEESSKLV